MYKKLSVKKYLQSSIIDSSFPSYLTVESRDRDKYIDIFVRYLNVLGYTLNKDTLYPEKFKTIELTPKIHSLLGKMFHFFKKNNFPVMYIVLFIVVCDIFRDNKDKNLFRQSYKNWTYHAIQLVKEKEYTLLTNEERDKKDNKKDNKKDIDKIELLRDYSTQEYDNISIKSFSDIDMAIEREIDREIDKELKDLQLKEGTENKMNIVGLRNVSNSCYLDSVLVALFAVPNRLIYNYIINRNIASVVQNDKKWITCRDSNKEDYIVRLNIQNSLRDIYYSIQGKGNIEKCTDLRKMIRACQSSKYTFHRGGPEDAGEFLSFLFTLFQVDIGEHSYTTYVSQDRTEWEMVDNTIVDNKASPIIPVHLSNIQEKKYNYLSSFLVQVEDVYLDDDNKFRYKGVGYSFKRKVEQFSIGKFLVFYIYRKYITERGAVKDRRQIIPESRIGDLNLLSVVVHTSGHYTCYFNSGGVWYFYDDLGPVIELIGSYDDLLSSGSERTDVLRDGVLYFYG